MGYIKLVSTLLNHYRKDKLTVYWEDGLIFKCTVDTVFEMDNDLETNDKNYKTWDAVLVKVITIIHPAKNPNSFIYEGALTEISEVIEPLRIELENGTVIWQKGDK